MKSDWPVVKLENVARIEFGTRVTKKKDAGTKYPVYGGGGETFRLDRFNRDSCYIVSRFAMSEECVRYVDGKFFLNDSGLTVASSDPNLNQLYLDRIILSKSKEIYELGRGAAQRNLDVSAFRNLEFPLPPLVEQKRIVAKLDEALSVVDELNSNTKRSLSELDTFWKASLNSVFSTNWEEVNLGTVSRIDWGNTNLTKSSYIDNGSYLAVSAAGPDGRINVCEHDAFTPVISAIGANCGRMFMPNEPFTAIKNTMTIRPLQEKLDSWFIYYFLSVNPLPRRGAGQPFISKGDTEQFMIALPPLSEQIRIVAKIDEIKEEIDRQREILSQKELEIDSLRSSILTAAFNGEL